MPAMNHSLVGLLGISLIALATTAALARDAGVQARMAGRGVDGPYYLAADVDAVKLSTRRRLLKQVLDDVRQPVYGDLRAAVEKDFTGCDAEQAAMLASGRLVAVPYNTVVTTLEKDELLTFPLLSDPTQTFGGRTTASKQKLRVEDGPLKGRELYVVDSWEMKLLTQLVATDRVWVRAGGNPQIPVGENRDDASRFWDAYQRQDQATAQGLIDAGKIRTLPAETQGTVTDAQDIFYIEIEVASDEATRRIWVPSGFLSFQAPSTTP